MRRRNTAIIILITVCSISLVYFVYSESLYNKGQDFDIQYVTLHFIQAQSWPIALSDRDLISIAKTGSGKTLGNMGLE